MKIRKFIVELHPDGKMTWCEYEDPKDSEKRAYNTALRDVIDCLNVEHANYTTMAVITDSDIDRANYLASATTCKRMSRIIENMAK